MELTKTGLPGLDKILGGGIPRGWTSILAGPPGAGKTCLSVGYLVEGIKQFDEPSIFCSFNESKKELYLTQKGFGYDLKKYETEGKLKFLDLSYGRALGQGELSLPQIKLDLPGLTKKIKESIDAIGARRMVIDPLTIISLLFDDVREVRYNFLRFFDVIRRFGVTTLAIAEKGLDSFSVEEFLAAGIIRLYNERLGAKRQRGIEIVKMRGINHKRGIFPLSITDSGVVISPDVIMPS